MFGRRRPAAEAGARRRRRRWWWRRRRRTRWWRRGGRRQPLVPRLAVDVGLTKGAAARQAKLLDKGAVGGCVAPGRLPRSEGVLPRLAERAVPVLVLVAAARTPRGRPPAGELLRVGARGGVGRVARPLGGRVHLGVARLALEAEGALCRGRGALLVNVAPRLLRALLPPLAVAPKTISVGEARAVAVGEGQNLRPPALLVEVQRGGPCTKQGHHGRRYFERQEGLGLGRAVSSEPSDAVTRDCHMDAERGLETDLPRSD
mmetsp:Transcript_41910/g.135954  ORF Transcript_41910/g.135954 Transcript_41910/m.135954 type:complete len:260 (+) Transcript_41910:405-1184(+)